MYFMFFAKIGQFPMGDGLLKKYRLAYFSTLQPELSRKRV